MLEHFESPLSHFRLVPSQNPPVFPAGTFLHHGLPDVCPITRRQAYNWFPFLLVLCHLPTPQPFSSFGHVLLPFDCLQKLTSLCPSRHLDHPERTCDAESTSRPLATCAFLHFRSFEFNSILIHVGGTPLKLMLTFFFLVVHMGHLFFQFRIQFITYMSILHLAMESCGLPILSFLTLTALIYAITPSTSVPSFSNQSPVSLYFMTNF